MSRRAPQKSEAVFGMLLEKSLNFELSFGGTGKRGAQMKEGDLVGISSLEWRLDQGVGCASQDAVDKKKVAKTVCVKSLDSPALQYFAHCNSTPALVAETAPGKNCTWEHHSSSKFDSAPHYYGSSFPFWNRFATGARA